MLGHEAGGECDPEQPRASAERACQGLRAQLVPAVGAIAYRAVVLTALRRAQVRFPFWNEATLDPAAEAWLLCVLPADWASKPEEAREIQVAVLASLVAVLTDVMGWSLARRYMNAAWPWALSDADSARQGEKKV